MSGDNAPLAMLQGAIDAVREIPDLAVTLVGDETVIRNMAAEHNWDLTPFAILHAPDVVTMEDEPLSIVRSKPESSLVKGLRALADGQGDAFVSAGNTGALFTAGTLVVRKVRGIQRASIGAVLPTEPNVLLLDSGANVVVEPAYLEEFAVMGSAYVRRICRLESPRVGLLNNGTESCKGTPMHVEAFRILSACPEINFVGNVEASAIGDNVCDVLVTDGFTGNILLKTMEGVGKLMLGRVKRVFLTNTLTKLAALAVKKPFTAVKKDFSSEEHGGAPILGLAKPVIKAHGSSGPLAVKNALRQAMLFAQADVIGDIADAAARCRARRQAEKENNENAKIQTNDDERGSDA